MRWNSTRPTPIRAADQEAWFGKVDRQHIDFGEGLLPRWREYGTRLSPSDVGRKGTSPPFRPTMSSPFARRPTYTGARLQPEPLEAGPPDCTRGKDFPDGANTDTPRRSGVR